MKKQCSILFGFYLACIAAASADVQTLSLAGTWRFQLDRADVGMSNRWFSRALPDKVSLPGALAAQGIGDDISTDTPWTGGIVDRSWFTAPEYAPYRRPGNVKVPFWLQPEKYYKGAAWYQRQVEIPRDWKGQHVVLALERPHWETRVWVDDRLVGTQNALATPHEYDLGAIPPGRHTLTVRVDNRMVIDVGHDSHSVSDHTQGNWNGIAGRLTLRARPVVWIENLQVYPALSNGVVSIRGRIGNAMANAGTGTLAVRVEEEIERGIIPAPDWHEVPVSWSAEGGSFDCQVRVASPKAWDEFGPALYRVTARIKDFESVPQASMATFGFRDVSTEGTQFTINGRRTFIRGTLECAIFPKTGHPPTDVESWRKVIKAAKAHGLNLLRFHSWCPPEAAFDAADELGMYFHIECSSWANSSSSLGDGKPVDQWIYEEADRILARYGNHPSFLFMLYGNEPGGRNHARFLARWVDHYRQRDPRRLYSSGAGWPQIAENQFHVTPDPRIQSWGGGLKSRINGRAPETTTDYRDYISRRSVPVVSHEIGQWCVYPNFSEVKKYTGYLKPKNFDIFRDTLRAHYMEDLAPQFLKASGRLQTLCYKEDIESALRTPGMGGFELLDLHDFTGQGTALVGVLDPFWESKGYVTAAEYSRFCNATVPLARLAKRVFTADESLEAAIEAAHFGPAPLKQAAASWTLLNDSGKSVAAGMLPAMDVPVGNGTPLGNIRIPLAKIPAPARYKLEASLAGHENDWDIWIYPAALPSPQPSPSIRIVDDLSDDAVASLRSGASVLLLIPPSRVAADKTLGKVALGFSSIFWNTAWTHRQPPHTLGILCDPRHPLFGEFPTDFCSNWQWWYLISRAGPMILDDLPPKIRPTVQVIDDWVTARRLGLVFEARMGRGRLMVCSIDLTSGLETNIVARQFRHSLLEYMGSSKFHPANDVTPAQVRALIGTGTMMSVLGARVVKADSEEPGFEAANLLDGDPRSLWHTGWTGRKASFPHEFEIAFDRPTPLTGFRFLPRQDNNRNGWIREYSIHVSTDGTNWTEAAAGEFARNSAVKTVPLRAPVQARFVKVVAHSAFDSQPFASLAEFEALIK